MPKGVVFSFLFNSSARVLQTLQTAVVVGQALKALFVGQEAEHVNMAAVQFKHVCFA